MIKAKSRKVMIDSAYLQAEALNVVLDLGDIGLKPTKNLDDQILLLSHG